MSNYRPSFAQNQLHKHGWEEGKGLGKSENGIKSAIKVKVKNNKVGLGHDTGAEFTFHWWDHIFNKTANAIEVIDDEEKEEVVIKKNESAKKIVPQLFYNKKPLGKSTNGKPLLYGTFVSGGTVSTNDYDSNGNTPQPSSETDSESEEEEEYSTDLLDRTFKKTGLTGHKGARHGFRLSGKLKRIEEQESFAAQNEDVECKKEKGKHNNPISEILSNDSDEKTKKKKNKKCKRKLANENICGEEKISHKKKKKKKNKSEAKEENVDCVENTSEKEHKKKKKKKNE